ncbi:unnamed protein product [Sphagnum troendelagicum]|uniref:Aquaporin n=1 Tax=Sphagnum troendelagicum TaxID=128251 RepID=A0ABP0TD48_9BRYO
MGSYNDGQVWVAELVGTTVFCVLGLGGIANAVLPGTKGHGIGFLGIAFCFGWGVFLALQFMGRISGFYNPAVALAGAVVGDIGWTRMLVCISAEMVGGFVAAILIWFTYLPHFQPLEFVQQGEDSLCNCCDLETGGVAVIKQELSEPAHRYVSAGTRGQRTTKSKVQPSDAEQPQLSAQSFWQTVKILMTGACKYDPQDDANEGSVNKLHPGARVKAKRQACGPSVRQRIEEDQEVKLTVFCTRPSVRKHYWLYCFWAECFLTFLLTYGAFSISNQGNILISDGAETSLYKTGLQPLLIGFLVFGLILCGGGTTGPALNPARDLAPRIAHWILPIPGKGPSEWWYSWVPILAPCAGAVLGGLFAKSMKHMLVAGL